MKRRDGPDFCDACGATNGLRPRDSELLCHVCTARTDYQDALQAELLTILEDWQKRRDLTDRTFWFHVEMIATSKEDERLDLRALATGGRR